MKHLRLWTPTLAILLLTTFVEGKTPFSPSIQPLQDLTGRTICTTWSINAQDGLWATAAHCVWAEGDVLPGSEPVTHAVILHGKPTTLIFINHAEDIAVVKSEDRAPTIPLGDAPAVDDNVSIFGFLWGGPSPTRFTGTIANIALQGKMIFNMGGGPGHSGSPVLNRLGEVVSVFQCGTMGFSCGSPYESLTQLQPYWGQ